MKLDAKNTRLLLSVAVLLLVSAGVVGSYFAMQFLQKEVRDVAHIKTDTQLTSDAEASVTQSKRKFEDPEIAQLYDYMNQIIPEQSYRSQFLVDIEKYANDSGVSISGITFNDGVAGAASPSSLPGTAVPVTLSIDKGVSYASFIAFMRKIENNLQFMQITSTNLQPDPSNKAFLSSATLDLQLLVRNAQ